MIRFNRCTLALASWACIVLTPTYARAACAQWDMNGSWRFVQSNLSIDRSPVFHLRQTGNQIEGNGSFVMQFIRPTPIGRDDRGYVTVGGSVRGVVNGDTVELTVFWTRDNSVGVYTGKIDAQGRMEGSTYDRRDPDNRATWISEQVVKCLVVASPPAPPAPPPPAAALPPPVKSQGRVKLDPTGPTNAPVRPICELAAQARARNSAAAPGLAAKCVEQQTLHVDDLAAKGEGIAMQDPLAIELRQQQPDDAAQRGFDIGMAAAEGQTAPGPGKQRIHDSLATNEQAGFAAAVAFSLERNNNADLARRGAAVAAGDPDVATLRNRRADVFYRLGFDIATAYFGNPALGADGKTAKGPGSLGTREKLSEAGKRGFDAAADYHLARKY